MNRTAGHHTTSGYENVLPSLPSAAIRQERTHRYTDSVRFRLWLLEFWKDVRGETAQCGVSLPCLLDLFESIAYPFGG
jgi:hypothetical protein